MNQGKHVRYQYPIQKATFEVGEAFVSISLECAFVHLWLKYIQRVSLRPYFSSFSPEESWCEAARLLNTQTLVLYWGEMARWIGILQLSPITNEKIYYRLKGCMFQTWIVYDNGLLCIILVSK